MAAYKPRTCEFCGITFTPDKPWNVTCSDTCRRERRRLLKYRVFAERQKLQDNLEWANYRIEALLAAAEKDSVIDEKEAKYERIAKDYLEQSQKLTKLESEKERLEWRIEKMTMELARAKQNASSPAPQSVPPQPDSESWPEQNAPATALETDSANQASESKAHINNAPVQLKEISPDEARPKPKMRKCANCGEEFESRDSRERYCCADCRLEARKYGFEEE